MKEDNNDDLNLIGHLEHTLLYHEILLRDEVRNVLFTRALKRVVNERSRVLDIGAGSGVWAVFAAKLGARKVTAIESDSSLIPIIKAHAAENGVAERVEVVAGNSTEVKLNGRYDVIVSETIGNQAFDEAIIPTMIDARKRFLARGGIIIPETVELVAAPAFLRSETKTPLGVPVTSNFLNGLASNFSFKYQDRNSIELLASAKPINTVDLTTVKQDLTYSGFTASWKLNDIGRANAVVLWARSRLLRGIGLDAWKTTNWSPVVCRFKPFRRAKGKIEFELSINANQKFWTVTGSGGGVIEKRSHAPVFALTKIKLSQGAV